MSLVSPDLLIDGDYPPFPKEEKQPDPPDEPDTSIPFYTGFTSGSTGQPKGFVRNQKSWLLSFACDSLEFSLSENDVIGALGQFTHSLPLYAVIRALYEGATTVFYSNFRPDKILKDLERQKVSVLYAVPTQLQALISVASTDQTVPSMRLVLSSGEKCSAAIRESLRTVFPNASFNEFYGSSELSYVSVAREDENPPTGSVGRPLKDVSIRILDEDGLDLASGKEGRIFVESPYRFIGYAGNEHTPSTHQNGDAHRGIFVGDTGYLDAAGYLHLTGRSDRMISSAARNIHPEEIEAHLINHPAIKNIAVLGVDDEKRGQRVVAIIQFKDLPVFKKDLSRYCGDLMAPYVVPKQFYHTPNWPLTASGKTDYVQLQSLLMANDLDLMS